MDATDIDNIRAGIARLDRLGRVAFEKHWHFATVTIWGVEHRQRQTAVGVTLHIHHASKSFAGPSPAEAIADAERYIREHDPAAREAEGWATLGAVVAP
jgi:hypothetical protein